MDMKMPHRLPGSFTVVNYYTVTIRIHSQIVGNVYGRQQQPSRGCSVDMLQIGQFRNVLLRQDENVLRSLRGNVAEGVYVLRVKYCGGGDLPGNNPAKYTIAHYLPLAERTAACFNLRFFILRR